jgi:cell division transport system ATP-binding protein
MQQHVVSLREVEVRQLGQTVLEHIHFDLRRGEFAYLIGKSGSGKSSLLKLLYAALPVYKGNAQVAGFDLSKVDRHTIPLLRRELGIVFQDFNLLMDRSVEQNLMFVGKATGWSEQGKLSKWVGELLDMVQLGDQGKRMPHTLSGGEQQRVAIARALLNTPQLILADEPTGNLDPETADEFLQLLRNLARQHHTAVLFATHDYRILEHFPGRVFRVAGGMISEEAGFAR